MVFLMVSTDAWKGRIIGMSRTPLLGTLSPGPLGPQLCFHQPLGLSWSGFHARRSGYANT
jgi:hypothetical protein